MGQLSISKVKNKLLNPNTTFLLLLSVMSTEAQEKGKHIKHGVDTDSMRRLIYRTIFFVLTFQILPKAVPLAENNNTAVNMITKCLFLSVCIGYG